MTPCPPVKLAATSKGKKGQAVQSCYTRIQSTRTTICCLFISICQEVGAFTLLHSTCKYTSNKTGISYKGENLEPEPNISFQLSVLSWYLLTVCWFVVCLSFGNKIQTHYCVIVWFGLHDMTCTSLVQFARLDVLQYGLLGLTSNNLYCQV